MGVVIRSLNIKVLHFIFIRLGIYILFWLYWLLAYLKKFMPKVAWAKILEDLLLDAKEDVDVVEVLDETVVDTLEEALEVLMEVEIIKMPLVLDFAFITNYKP